MNNLGFLLNEDNFSDITPNIQITIRRNAILQDSYKYLQENIINKNNIKNKLQIEFLSEQGHAERGIDGGGLFKEFIDAFLKTAFSSETKLFLPTTENWLVNIIFIYLFIHFLFYLLQ